MIQPRLFIIFCIPYCPAAPMTMHIDLVTTSDKGVENGTATTQDNNKASTCYKLDLYEPILNKSVPVGGVLGAVILRQFATLGWEFHMVLVFHVGNFSDLVEDHLSTTIRWMDE